MEGELYSQRTTPAGDQLVTLKMPWRFHDQSTGLIRWIGTALEIEIRAGNRIREEAPDA